MQSHQDTEASEEYIVLAGLSTPDSNELQQDRVDQFYGHTGRVGKYRTGIQNTFGNRLKRDVIGKSSRELFICELVFATAETCIGLEHIASGDNAKGKYLSERRPDTCGTSCLFFVFYLSWLLANVDGGSAHHLGDRHNQGTTSQHPSRVHFHPT